MMRPRLDHIVPCELFARCVTLVVGAVLCFSAVMKMHSLLVLDQIQLMRSPIETFALAEVECVLGIWLISGMAHTIAVAAARLFFLIVALYLVFLYLNGETQCECLGSLTPKLLTMLTLDCAILICLIFFTKADICWSGQGKLNVNALFPRCDKRRIMCGLMLAALVLVGREQILRTNIGSWLTEESIRVSGVTFVRSAPGRDGVTVITGNVRLENFGDRSVTVLGAILDCDCSMATGFPFRIHAGSIGTIAVRITSDGKTSDPRRVVKLLTDVPSQPRVLVMLHSI